MFLLNKVTAAKRSSREFTHDDRESIAAEMQGMDYMYAGASDFRPRSSRSSRTSRTRISLFGAKKRSGTDEKDVPLSPTSPNRTLNEKPSVGSLSSGSRRRLKRASSKTSIATSFRSQGSDERPISRVDQLLGRSSSSQPSVAASRTRGASISQPFNFTHLSHANQRDANAIPAGAQEVSEGWNRALARESHLRPLTAKASMSSMHSRNDSLSGVPLRDRSNSSLSISVPRNRSNSTLSSMVSPAASENPSIPSPLTPALQEPMRHACPITPPLRASSRHCLRIMEHPEEDQTRHDQDIPQVNLTDVDQEVVGHAVTTPGDSSCGNKSAGIERIIMGSAREEVCPSSPPVDASFEPLFDESRFPTDINQMPSVSFSYPGQDRFNTERIPEKVEPERLAPAINLMPPFDPTQDLLTVRSRPLSQMSALSDTLNGHFAVPQGPVRNRRMSRRISTIRKSVGPTTLEDGVSGDPSMVDSWEEDIDWCYEHEADADCEFNWDQQSALNPDQLFADFDSGTEADIQPSAVPVPVIPERSPINHFRPHIEVPEIRQETLVTEKRITGLFEDKLLLPPSPGYPSSPRLRRMRDAARARERDSGFESVTTCEETVIVRAAKTAVRHRSISASPSVPDLGMVARSNSYREELSRVAKQLDDHIALLNTGRPSSLRTEDSAIPTFMVANRARANSEATCVTLCSDTDTVTPTEINEVITPSNSAHNSYNFMKPRSSSVVGAGLAVESRTEKNLGFPSAAIPGVIEVGPDSLFIPEETEFVHFF